MSLIRDVRKKPDTQFTFAARSKNGKLLERTGVATSGAEQARTERFEFDVPINDVKEFVLGTRRIRSIEFEDVHLKLPAGPDENLPFAPPPAPAPAAARAEPPKLRFLAWQDEWDAQPPNKPAAAFHTDGSPITDPSELRLLGAVHTVGCDVSAILKGKRQPRFLHLWFSHPLIDQQSLREVTLLDGAGKTIPPEAAGMMGSGVQGPDDSDDRLGWITYTLTAGNAPAAITVRLRYTLGPWETQRQFKPDEEGIVALGNGSQFSGVGQDAKGKAFFAIAVDMKQDADRQFGVVAVTRDGRDLQSSGGGSGGGVGEPVHVQRFTFAAPLADISSGLDRPRAQAEAAKGTQ